MITPANPHARPAAEVLAGLAVSAADGLSAGDVRSRLAVYGANAVPAPRPASPVRLLLHQFASPIVYLLGTAAALAFYFGEIEEGIAIVTVLAINALIGFVTELRAARSIEALRNLGKRTGRVRREGTVRVLSAEEMVPGDIVLLDAGDSVSADLRLLEASRIAADESSLTGESVAADKQTDPVAADAPLADRTCMLFKGTAITRGSGVGVVVATGLATELGRITRLVLDAGQGSSPLERKLARLSRQLVWATLAIAAAIGVVGIVSHHDPLLMIEAAIALAVAAIPEGLPIVATLALARGMWRMARQNALIERLSAVETLGATTLILTDKTGTLTENRMAVRRLALPTRDIVVTSSSVSMHPDEADAEALLRIAVLCNDADLEDRDEAGSGDPMEIALLRVGLDAGLDRQRLRGAYPLARKLAFDADARMMATVHRDGAACIVAVKGAPEAVIAAASHVAGAATLDEATRAQWFARAEALGKQGLRVLACATKSTARADADPYRDLTLVGLIGLEDPPRADVPAAVRACKQAGIRVVMATGDHAVTARSIGSAVGLVERDANLVEGGGIAAAIAAGADALRRIDIFARVTPADKLSLVRAYQAAGDVVAMTGDGVNDAPALRQADIGIAMGQRGTDVAREAAAMVLLDDAFPTIVMAIREGRVIFGNIRRFIAYLLSCNLSEVMVVGIAVISALPLPVLPLQILYLNLVTDVFPAFALAMGEGEAGVLTRPPRDPAEPIVGRSRWVVIVLHGATLTAGTFGALVAAGALGLDEGQSVTVTFLTLAFAQLWHVFNMRNLRSGVLFNEVTQNRWLWAALALCGALLAIPPYVPPLANVLHLAPLTGPMWTVVVASSLVPLVLIQAAMLIARTGGWTRAAKALVSRKSPRAPRSRSR